MSTSKPGRNRKSDHRRALELLASCRDGCTEAIMLAHGFINAQIGGPLSEANRKTFAHFETYRF
jgi:hypothetical protein